MQPCFSILILHIVIAGNPLRFAQHMQNAMEPNKHIQHLLSNFKLLHGEASTKVIITCLIFNQTHGIFGMKSPLIGEIEFG